MHEAVLGTHNSSAHASQDCVPPLPANLTVYVGNAPPAQLLARTAGRHDGSSVCAAGIAVPAGRPTVIDCGRFLHGEPAWCEASGCLMYVYARAFAFAPLCVAELLALALSSRAPAGRYVTLTATAPLGTALSLCNVQLLGGEELPLSQHMLLHRKQTRRKGSGTAAGGASDGPGALRVVPASLLPNASLPIDGDAGSCLLAAAGSSSSTSWQLQLDGSYSVLALRLAATPAAAWPAGNSSQAGGGTASTSMLAVGLLDAGGAEVASWATAGGSSGGSDSSNLSAVLLELPAATHAAAVRVEGFASLCNLQLLVASSRRLGAYQLAPLANLGGSGSSGSSRGSNASTSGSFSTSPPSSEQPQAAGEWRVLDGGNGSALSAGLAAALLDGNPTTCAVLRQVETLGGLGPLRPLAVELQLDRPVR